MTEASYPGPVRYLTLACECTCISGAQQNVLQALVRFADNATGVVNGDPERVFANPVLARRAKLSDKGFRLALAALEKIGPHDPEGRAERDGWVVITRRRKEGSKERAPHVFRLVVPQHVHDRTCFATLAEAGPVISTGHQPEASARPVSSTARPVQATGGPEPITGRPEQATGPTSKDAPAPNTQRSNTRENGPVQVTGPGDVATPDGGTSGTGYRTGPVQVTGRSTRDLPFHPEEVVEALPRAREGSVAGSGLRPSPPTFTSSRSRAANMDPAEGGTGPRSPAVPSPRPAPPPEQDPQRRAVAERFLGAAGSPGTDPAGWELWEAMVRRDVLREAEQHDDSVDPGSLARQASWMLGKLHASSKPVAFGLKIIDDVARFYEAAKTARGDRYATPSMEQIGQKLSRMFASDLKNPPRRAGGERRVQQDTTGAFHPDRVHAEAQQNAAALAERLGFRDDADPGGQ